MNNNARLQMEIVERIYTLRAAINDLEGYVGVMGGADLLDLEAAEEQLEMLIIAVMRQRRKSA